MNKQQVVTVGPTVQPFSPQKPTEMIPEVDVRIRAFQLWEVAGRPHGQDQRLWADAERELRDKASGRYDGAP
jgi:hypothetical protein